MWTNLVDLFGSRLWEPHGHCFLWTPSLLWTMVSANLLIGLAYYSIPLTLLTLVRRRKDLVHRPVFRMFALFIFACGTTHLIKIGTLWVPVYWLQGAADALTAGVSVVTAVALWPLLPRILALPSSAQLQAANHALHAQLQMQQQMEAALHQRTLALEATNHALTTANRELEVLSYAIAHDLRSPLRAMAHVVGWITEDAAAVLPAPSRTHLTKLQQRVQRMERLLDDLLAYLRVGQQEQHAEPVATDALVYEVVEFLAPPPGFTVTVAAPMPVVHTPRAPLATIFRNLIGNAIKHHQQPASGQVLVTAQELGEWIQFRVTDNEPGIEPVFHERIFGFLQTLQPRDEVEGSGMGLSLVKKTVEHYGGTVGLTAIKLS